MEPSESGANCFGARCDNHGSGAENHLDSTYFLSWRIFRHDDQLEHVGVFPAFVQ